MLLLQREVKTTKVVIWGSRCAAIRERMTSEEGRRMRCIRGLPTHFPIGGDDCLDQSADLFAGEVGPPLLCTRSEAFGEQSGDEF
jgi:hypothetical protein